MLTVVGAYSLLYAEDGDKYELVSRGLTVNRLEVYDNGTYECRAEVASHGNVKLRLVHLEVLCKYFTSSSALNTWCSFIITGERGVVMSSVASVCLSVCLPVCLSVCTCDAVTFKSFDLES